MKENWIIRDICWTIIVQSTIMSYSDDENLNHKNFGCWNGDRVSFWKLGNISKCLLQLLFGLSEKPKILQIKNYFHQWLELPALISTSFHYEPNHLCPFSPLYGTVNRMWVLLLCTSLQLSAVLTCSTLTSISAVFLNSLDRCLNKFNLVSHFEAKCVLFLAKSPKHLKSYSYYCFQEL